MKIFTFKPLGSTHLKGRFVHCVFYPLFYSVFLSVFIPMVSLSASTHYEPVHPDPVLEEWRWRSFPELKGLGLQCMVEAKDGAMWFGVDEGVVRYDGIRWTTFTPKDGLLGAPVKTLCATSDGSVYAGTEWGISRFSDGVWNRVFPIEGDLRWHVSDLMEASDRSLWAGTSRGALRLGRSGAMLYTTEVIKAAWIDSVASLQFVTVPEWVIPVHGDFGVWDVYEDRGGQMWLGLILGEILRCKVSHTEPVDLSEWRLFTEADGLGIGLGPRIIQTRNGIVMTIAGNGLKGTNRFDGTTWTHDPGVPLHSILETKDGTLWTGSSAGHLVAVRRRGVMVNSDHDVTIYNPKNVPLPSTRLIGLLEASDGALWIAGLRKEVVRLDYQPTQWTTYEGLQFWCETSDGALWFTSVDSGAVRYDGQGWTRYGTEDGLMNDPMSLIETQAGVLWAVGSHDSTSATARFDGNRWILETHPRLSYSIYGDAAYTSLDGSIWVGASPEGRQEQGHFGGVLHYDGQHWVHHKPPEAPLFVYAIGGTLDGSVWFGAKGLYRFDGQAWVAITVPKALATWIHSIYGTNDGDLWVGTRADGVFRYDGKIWHQYGVLQGLADDRVDGILKTSDSKVWVATPKGISGFDGQTWTTFVLPADLVLGEINRLCQSRDGTLWINSMSWRVVTPEQEVIVRLHGWTAQYKRDADPPETEITLAFDEVSQPGNTTIAWTGGDLWRSTPDAELKYAWRLDGGDWSSYAYERNHIFELLSSGDHTFEVKARDRDFNEDPTPAVVRFTVIPPVWQQSWFIGLLIVLLSAIGLQTGRVIRRDRRLQESNAALSAANKELLVVNTTLQEKTDALEVSNRELNHANVQIQEQTERKSRFLASMSHEIRTPMNAIIGFTNMVIRRAGDVLPERQKGNLEKVVVAANRLLELINGLLDLSKIEAGRMDVVLKRFDVGALLQSCCAEVEPLVAENANVELICDVGDDVGEAETDEGRMRQIVTNLLSNAIKFTEQGEVAVCVVRDGDDFVIAVSDTGAGIPPDALDTVFEEFQQVAGSDSERKGTGLGLPICKGFAELLGGSIGVESEIGKGSVFTVQIPAVYKGLVRS